MSKENTHRFMVEIEADNSFVAGCVMQDMLDSAKAKGCPVTGTFINHDCVDPKEQPSALSTQVGGSHYKSLAIQPVEFCQRNNLNYCEASIIKYLCRWRNKNGLQDLQKAKHFLDLLIEMEFPKEACADIKHD